MLFRSAQLNKYFPKLCPPYCGLEINFQRLRKNHRIRVFTLAEVGRISWVGGGLQSPIIGPHGHVYAIASNVLFVFPAPGSRPLGGGAITDPVVGTATTDPPPSTQPASQHFSGPVTPGGYRLFACLELDGDDCGKSTNKQVALAFCQSKGFSQVDDVDTETKKVKAARLDGQLCSKSKCKVFDEIVCGM